MIKLEVIETFTLGRFKELNNIERMNKSEQGKLFKGDKFECAKDLADYLLGKNAYNKAFVKVIEVIPEEPIKEETIVEKPKKPSKKKKSKK